MYKKILLALDTNATDQTLISHVSELARIHQSKLVLLHVCDGWAARNYNALKLAESQEMKEDKAYLDKTAEYFQSQGFETETVLALGNPPTEILRVASEKQCNLITMTSHGHRLLADIVLGSTIDNVRHKTHIPLLVVRG